MVIVQANDGKILYSELPRELLPVRYSQKYFGLSFDQGWSVSETLVALKYNLLDINSLCTIDIVKYDNKLWCDHTKHLRVYNELSKDTLGQSVLDKLRIVYIAELNQEH
ncbi:unnamed protein product [Didymodactylos carnosus]|uniref:Uncharacterized protein n=1 Tax=Didymodactylos carnosus TaxID=1234261 RepID=A0A815NA54_9BILA|nr:unnamed protein product [Didymodactylos carnosus]CAF1435440.1 unnamed protein product [Didymodactylos carnosus]CAF4075965.1 unnamed protein product [Didymodactylos carnosus]CAF4312829.1 unnamed protein product [Didymodactylos carnosus]